MDDRDQGGLMGTMSVARSATTSAGAREIARNFLEGVVPTIASGAADTVALVVSELVTNTLRHDGDTCTLDLTAYPDSIAVAVHDGSRTPTSMPTRSPPAAPVVAQRHTPPDGSHMRTATGQ
ncbi:hypothetical protein [Streptomyces sp. NPDC060022]|uniref:hypothetical protein n=1 Tax=Streptomyces sp. NPDC060022 TaxID=3347039 RepID=UPI0036A04D74